MRLPGAPRERVRRRGEELSERLRTYAVVAAEAGLAAGIAWFIARNVLDNDQPFFAPAVAVGAIASAIGNRVRRTMELLAGVVIGAFVGHRIIRGIGTGPVQTGLAEALAHRDVAQAEEALRRFAKTKAERQTMTEMVAAAREVAVLSPWRRRRLTMIRRYQHAAEHLENAYTSSREMVRWATATVRAGEPVPAGLPAAIEHVGQALRLLHRDFLAGREPAPSRARARQAVKDADEACADGVERSGQGIVSQVRATVSELLQASGLGRAEANEQAGLTERDQPA